MTHSPQRFLWLVVPRAHRAHILDAGGARPFSVCDYEQYAQRIACARLGAHGVRSVRFSALGDVHDAATLLASVRATEDVGERRRVRWTLVALPRDVQERHEDMGTSSEHIAQWAIATQQTIDARCRRAAIGARAQETCILPSTPRVCAGSLLPSSVETPAWGDREHPRTLATLVLWCERAWHARQRRPHTLAVGSRSSAAAAAAAAAASVPVAVSSRRRGSVGVLHAAQYVRVAVARYAPLYDETRNGGRRLVRLWSDASAARGVSPAHRTWLAALDGELRILRSMQWRDVGWASGADGRQANAALVAERRASAKRHREAADEASRKRMRMYSDEMALRALQAAMSRQRVPISPERMCELRSSLDADSASDGHS